MTISLLWLRGLFTQRSILRRFLRDRIYCFSKEFRNMFINCLVIKVLLFTSKFIKCQFLVLRISPMDRPLKFTRILI